MRETEIGAAAKAWLEGRGFEVFQEVQTRHGRPDLVGRAGSRVVCVECKVSLGLGVIAQASRWLDLASEAWVCVPIGRRDDGRLLAEQVCRDRGIGIGELYGWERRIVVQVEARAHDPKRLSFWDGLLHPEQKSAAPAGSSRGGHSTDWSRSVARLCEFVAANPGCTLRQAVEAIDHHYTTKASAIGSLSGLLNRTRNRPAALEPVRIDGKGSRATLWPQDGSTF